MFHILKVAFPVVGIPPWVHRIEEVKASLAVNVETERKVAQLNEEMQDLIRGLKTRVCYHLDFGKIF